MENDVNFETDSRDELAEWVYEALDSCIEKGYSESYD